MKEALAKHLERKRRATTNLAEKSKCPPNKQLATSCEPAFDDVMKKAIIDATLETFDTVVAPTYLTISTSEKLIRLDFTRNLIKNLLAVELDKSPLTDPSLLVYSLFVKLCLIFP